MLLLSAGASVIAAILLLPLISDLISLARLPLRSRATAIAPRSDRSRFLFLIPAHDEESMIAGCVNSVLGMRYPGALVDVLVVADNCSDQTAARARAMGVKCWERSDKTLRGKPRALAWALSLIDLPTYDAIVILDADAVVDPDYAAALDAAGPLRGKAVECFDDVRNRGTSSLTRMAALYSAARFRAAFCMKRALGLTIPLSDGMCVGTDVLREHPWSAFGLAEDYEVYALLTAAGVPIDLAVGAHLYAEEARDMSQASTQRQRWLSGRLTALTTYGPRLVASAKITWHQKLDAIAELASPGPAVHLATAALFAAIEMTMHAPGAMWISTALLTSLLRPTAYALIGVSLDPEPARAVASLLTMPFYATWRLMVAVRGLRLLQGGDWVRTARS
jgi:cellulose synthase/poly-beta-1,6-N-acetylglucosamine synthase-like glycosyltransferase